MGAGGSKQQRYSRDLGERPSPPGKPILIPGTPRTDPDVISIRWDPPQYIGGSKIIGYLVEHRRTGSPHWVRATPLLVRGNTLTLSGLEPGMRYQFRITAENQAGKSEPGLLSEAFAVSYQKHVSLAPSFVKQLNDTTAIENEKIEFSVVVEGTPTPKISWYKDGVEVFSTRRQRILVEGEKSCFIIHQAAIQDEGEIKCTATNIAGHVVTKASLILEAGAGLRLPRQYEEGLIFELGEAVRLRVGITGKPEPSVTWYHDGTEILSDGRIEVTRKDKHACLKIAEASRRDRGEYRVTATNKLGSDSASILVTITDRPLSPGKAQVVMTLGRCVTLAWTPPNDDGGCKIGNYIVEYYRIGWNMWLKAATCRQLTTTLGDLIEGSEYKFRVKAENPFGVSDPGSESEVIFIPDPKRGLLEAPPKGERDILIRDSMEWQEATRKHKELEAAKNVDKEWEELPSQVSLANQVLRKVKMAPKRGWSEDSQGSPPTTPERQLHPVPPKRKLRDKRKAQAILEEGPLMIHDQDENDEPKEATSSARQESSDLRRYSSPDNVHSSSEMMFVIVTDQNDKKKKEEAEDEDEGNEMHDKGFSLTLPPLSFSAPELGSCDPYEMDSLRISVSSSELLHERTLARMNKDIAELEAEDVLRTKYGMERKRSFERRHKRDPYVSSVSYKEKKMDEDIYDIPEGIEGKTKRKTSKIDEQEEEEEEALRHRGGRRSSKDKFMQSDSSFEEFSTRIEENEYGEESDYDEDYDYEEGDDEYEGSDMDMKYDFEKNRTARYLRQASEEETFHRNMTMLPMPAPIIEIKPAKDSSPLPVIKLNEEPIDYSPPTKRNDSIEMFLEEIRRSTERETRKSPEKIPERQIINSREQDFTVIHDRSVKPYLEKEETVIPQTSFKDVPLSSSPTSILPKPILKVNRDDLSDIKTDKKNRNIISRISLKKFNVDQKPNLVSSSASTESDKRNKKKVRIEEPFDNDFLEGDENLVMTGEVAKNRRRMNRQKRDSNDPANVVISHYSDIVREYGTVNKKPKPQLYLNYEELKAAAERSAPVENADASQSQNKPATSTPLPSSPSDVASEQKQESGKQSEKESEGQTAKTEEEQDETETASTLDLTEPTKFQYITEFILDLFLFCIAFYLYLFKDPRLAVPVLILMIYRKVHDTVSHTVSNRITPKIRKIKSFFKKPEKTD